MVASFLPILTFLQWTSLGRFWLRIYNILNLTQYHSIETLTLKSNLPSKATQSIRKCAESCCGRYDLLYMSYGVKHVFKDVGCFQPNPKFWNPGLLFFHIFFWGTAIPSSWKALAAWAMLRKDIWLIGLLATLFKERKSPCNHSKSRNTKGIEHVQ